MRKKNQPLNTPETSDHSNDEMVQTSQEDPYDLANFEPEPNVMKEMELKWNQEDYTKLAKLLRQHLTFNSVYQRFYPKYCWFFISMEALSMLRESNMYYEWVRKISLNFLLRSPSKSTKKLPFKSYFGPMQKLYERVKKDDAWSDSDEVEEFYALTYNDLTRSGIEKRFPMKSKQDIERAYSAIGTRIFSEREIVLLQLLLDGSISKDTLINELYLRSYKAIQHKKSRLDESVNLSREFPLLKYSPYIAKNEDMLEKWSEEDEVKMASLRTKPIMFSELVDEFPQYTWFALVDKILKKTKKDYNNWPQKAHVYGILYHRNALQDWMMLLLPDSSLDSLVEQIDHLLSSQWSENEIEKLYHCIYHDLTASSLNSFFPNRTLDEIKGAVSTIQSSTINWSKNELKLIVENDPKVLHEELVLRIPMEIKTQLRRSGKNTKVYERFLIELSSDTEKPPTEDPIVPLRLSEEDELKLESLVNEPLSFIQLLKELNITDIDSSWESVGKKILQSTSKFLKASWLRKIYLYHYIHQPNYEGDLFDVTLQFNYQELEDAINWLKGKNWTNEDIEQLSVLTFVDTTRSTLSHHFSTKDIEEVREGALRFYYNKQPFNDAENEYLENHVTDDINDISHNLPTRTQEQLKTQISKHLRHAKIKASYNQLMLKEGKSFVMKRDPAKEILFRIRAERAKSIENARPVVNNNFLEDDEEIILPSKEEVDEFFSNLEPEMQKHLEYCVKLDLTLDTLKEKLPSLVEKNFLYVLFHPVFDANNFTIGEKDLLMDLVKDEVTLEECFPEFPLRKKRFISSKYQEFEYISGRKLKFKSLNEQLAYEARMAFVGSKNDLGQTRSRKRAFELINDLEEIENEAKIITSSTESVQLTAEEVALKEARSKALYQARMKRLEELKQRSIQRAMESKLQKLERDLRRANGEYKKAKSEADSILESSEYFYTLVGNRKPVEFGQKRQRIQTTYYQPEIEIKKPIKLKKTQRQLEKQIIKKKLKKVAKTKRKYSKQKVLTDDDIIDEFKEFYDERVQGGEDEEDEADEEDHISPYDPPDINSDSMVDLNGRELFGSSLYYDEPKLPEIKFCNIDDVMYDGEYMTKGKFCMTTKDDNILYDDNLAVEVITAHIKSYKDLPITFPSLLSEQGSLNKLNNIKIRCFLYPEHVESFVLAEPKSNELDPISEISKLFMITYSLYFSHSIAIKRIILEEYCQKLEKTVEDNDFSEFLFTIDKWNLLMLELSPNQSSVEPLRNKDINSLIRKELLDEESRAPKIEDLSLDIFYKEISYEFESPTYESVEDKAIANEEDSTIAIINSVERTRNLNPVKPDNFEADFLKRLQTKTQISRYTIQQLLLRVYSRVVSTDSRKLKSYKAFTAETYGELLPSFTSEVLEKVKLLPTDKFYDLGSGVGNTTFQAALEYGSKSGGCEMMHHASSLTLLQEGLIQKHLKSFGLKPLDLNFELFNSFENNERVRKDCLDCQVLIINNFLFPGDLNASVGKLLVGLKPGTRIISLRNFISPRYRATFDSVFDYFRVEKHEMSDICSVSWTANKIPYYISYVEETIRPEYLSRESTIDSKYEKSSSSTPNLDLTAKDQVFIKNEDLMTPPTD